MKKQKILIIRFSSIGDIVLTTPVVRAVKKQLNAEVHFVTRDRFHNLVINNPYIDKIYLLEDSLSSLIEQLNEESYDLILDMHKNLRSRRIIKSLKVESLNFDKLNIKKWLLVNLKLDRMPNIHIVDRYFSAFQSVGIQKDGDGLDFFYSPNIDEKTSALSLPIKYDVIVLGATYFTKRIPFSKIKEIIELSNLPIVLIGGKDVLELSKSLIESCSKHHIEDYCGTVDIETSAYIIEKSNRVITADTGMMHIAAALHKPIISFWGNTVPALGMYPYYGSKTDKNTTVEVHGLSCRPCSKIGYNNCPKGHFKCMEDIKIGDLNF